MGSLLIKVPARALLAWVAEDTKQQTYVEDRRRNRARCVLGYRIAPVLGRMVFED